MSGGVPSKEFNKNLFNILNQLESDINLLNDPNYIRYIISLLQAGADRNTQNQYGKTLSHYLDEKLSNILNNLADNGGLLDNYAQYIMFLLQAGADPSTKGQDGKTLSYYLYQLQLLSEQIRHITNLLKEILCKSHDKHA